MRIAVAQATVSWEAAHTAVAAAVRHAEATDLRINVAVADAAGNLVAFLRMPGAFPQSIQIAIDKARTAGGFGFPTERWLELIGDNEGMKLGFAARPGLTVFGGGAADPRAAAIGRRDRRLRRLGAAGQRLCSGWPAGDRRR